MSEQYSRKSYIKDICLELPGYKFHHKSYGSEGDDNFEFLGREAARQEIMDTIIHGTNNGAYLISGYRGMGKTSFVNKVLSDSNAELKKRKGSQLKPVNISFGKSSIVYNDLLRQITVSLMNNVTDKTHTPLIWLIKPAHTFIFASFFFIIAIIALTRFQADLYPYLPLTNFRNSTFYVTAAAAVSFALAFLLSKIMIFFLSRLPSIRIYYDLAKLYTRSKAEISEEENIQSIVKAINFGLFAKTNAKYSPMTSKEIELELIRIINRIDRSRRRKGFAAFLGRKFNWVLAKTLGYYRINNYVFVFDELDKIDPGIGGDDYYKEMKDVRVEDQTKTYIDDQRDRRQMMLNIISSLKHLITESNAKFIFITGREMFEASLADIADRQFSFGSIFHKIIYIDSFLKDKRGNDPDGLSNLTENYLKRLILPANFIKHWEARDIKRSIWDNSLILLYREYLTCPHFWENGTMHTHPQVTKIIQTLQQFIIYLTYRTNGSPKKLGRLVEDFIVNTKSVHKKKIDQKLIVKQKRKPGHKLHNELFLHLSYNDQARFGFIDYLYRPFLLNYNRRLKNNSDYLLVSTTYLVDHILKFHPVAFSTRNLELLPEVLSTNRTPQLRNFIDDLLLFLSYSYIRDTEIKIFDYKFHNKVANEIYFLTNMFEQESAAFNFTLDESYPIKIHIRNKILELRKIHKDYKSSGSYEFIHSISGLNNLLGDIRYYDQEYTDSLTAYTDALQALRSIGPDFKRRIEIVILIIQLQLKIGLTFEKIKTYENALAYFTDAMEYSREIILCYCNDAKWAEVTGRFVADKSEKPEANSSMSVSLNELLHNSLQAFVANLYLIEKLSPSGITIQTINHTVELLNELFQAINKSHKTHLAQSIFYNHLGVLVYYKNMFVPGLDQQFHNALFEKEIILAVNPDTLVTARKEIDGGEKFRFPNLSFYYSMLSMKKVLEEFRAESPAGESAVRSASPKELFSEALELIRSEQVREIGNKHSLSCMANILSRIGDILLTNIEQDPTIAPITGNSVCLTEIFSEYMKSGYEAYERGTISGHDLTGSLFVDNELKKIITEGVSGPLKYRIQLIIGCYVLSSKYYSAAGKMANCSFQLKRTLRVLLAVVYIGINKDPGGSSIRIISRGKYYSELIDVIEKLFLTEILKNISTNSNSTDRSQVLRYKYYTNESGLHYPVGSAKYIYNNLANSPEVREAIILFAKVRLLSKPFENTGITNLHEIADEQSIVTGNNSISHQWTRILELEFQASLNWKIFKEIIDPSLTLLFNTAGSAGGFGSNWLDNIYEVYSKTNAKILSRLAMNTYTLKEYMHEARANFEEDRITMADTQARQLWAFYSALHNLANSDQLRATIDKMFQVVANSIHSLYHVIEILQTYGNSYPAGYAFTGDQYRRLGRWMQLYHAARVFQEVLDSVPPFNIKSELELLIGVEPLRILEPITLFQTAILNYHRAIELHHDGNTYKNKIQSLNYLDDDFNDSVDHFETAIERQRMNSGNLQRLIIKLSKVVDKSQLFIYKSYVNNSDTETAVSP